MKCSKQKFLSYAIVVVLLSVGLWGFQVWICGFLTSLPERCREQVAGKPALVDIKSIAISNSLTPGAVRGALEERSPPANNVALAQIWTLAKRNNISKYEVAFYLTDTGGNEFLFLKDSKYKMKPKSFLLLLLSNAIWVGLALGLFGLVHAGVKRCKKSPKA